MPNRDKAPLILLQDIPAALGLLSRLPVPVDAESATARGAAAAWAYPVAGMIIGAIAACVASVATGLGLPAAIAAVLALATLVIITGAMHEDGLADSADGLWGGWDPARRLAIMKDSHIGVYGVAALVLSFLLRWTALGGLVVSGLHWPGLITAAILSRASMTALMAMLPHARADGLSQSVGRPTAKSAGIAAIIALVAAILFWGWWGLVITLAAGLATVLCIGLARAKIGGQTGDILGATQQVTEIAVLLGLLTIIGS